jgi:hypothetical protein
MRTMAGLLAEDRAPITYTARDGEGRKWKHCRGDTARTTLPYVPSTKLGEASQRKIRADLPSSVAESARVDAEALRALVKAHCRQTEPVSDQRDHAGDDQP